MSLQLDGTSGVLGNSGAFIAGTAVASTSGTSITFTSIPSWVKRINVMFQTVSTNGSSLLLLRIGTVSGIETTGYASGSSQNTSTGGYATSTAGFVLSVANNTSASSSFNGSLLLSSLGSNTWAENGSLYDSNYTVGNFHSGSKTLGGTLTQLSITTVNGTDTFDAGTINILYE